MKELLVFGETEFKITVPDEAKITFGPFSPPSRADSFGRTHGFNPVGTLRIYQGSKDNIIAVFSNVTGFRDLSMGYMEKVAVEEGDSVWKSDQDGYVRESSVRRTSEWVDDSAPKALPPAKPRRTKKS